MRVTLPEDYRAYLTQLGNGGAGPAYGLASSPFPRTNLPGFSAALAFTATTRRKNFRM